MTSESNIDDKFIKAFGAHMFRSGFLKLSVLRILAERPLHGYALMKEIEKITGSTWRPSPGSIYPALQTLLKNDMVTSSVSGRQRIYAITPRGRTLLDQGVGQVRARLTDLQNLLEYKSEPSQ